MTTVFSAMSNADSTVDDGMSAFVLVIIALLALAVLALFIVALISVVSSVALTVGGKVVWALVVFAFPIVGSILWFAWGRNAQLSRTAPESSKL